MVPERQKWNTGGVQLIAFELSAEVLPGWRVTTRLGKPTLKRGEAIREIAQPLTLNRLSFSNARPLTSTLPGIFSTIQAQSLKSRFLR